MLYGARGDGHIGCLDLRVQDSRLLGFRVYGLGIEGLYSLGFRD